MEEHWRILGALVLAAIALAAAVASVIAVNHTECDESGTLAFLALGLGVVAAGGTVATFGKRWWAIAAAAVYGIVVYAWVAFTALGNCTA